jgi:hypothetical protein
MDLLREAVSVHPCLECSQVYFQCPDPSRLHDGVIDQQRAASSQQLHPKGFYARGLAMVRTAIQVYGRDAHAACPYRLEDRASLGVVSLRCALFDTVKTFARRTNVEE